MEKARSFRVLLRIGLLCLLSSSVANACDVGLPEWSVSGTVPDRPIDGMVPLATASPESQGINGNLLKAGIQRVRYLPSLNSLLIARNGVVVCEEYFNGHNATDSYEVASVSKSIMSALVGIAIERGHIESIHQPVSELLPEAFADAEWSKCLITMRDLLTMQAGMLWEPAAPLDLVATQHVVEDVVGQSISKGQGSRFEYSTGLTHLASAVIASRSGMSTCEFATTNLFEPLGVAPEVWARDADGVHTGGWYMYFTPRELLRFGLLYLQGGNWEGQQIVPDLWVRLSLSQQVSLDDANGYGFWWWLSSFVDSQTSMSYKIQSARGGGEQMIWLVPELNLVMVTTSDHAYQGSPFRFDSEQFLHEVVIPAAVIEATS